MTFQGLIAVVPAVDEEATIGEVVRGLLARGVETVLVADNGSRDRTAARAREAGAEVVDAPRRGYGSACQAALAVLPPDACAVVFCDADGADELDRLQALVRDVLRGEADVVIGSRTLGGAEPGALTWPQRAGNRLASALFRLLYGVPVSDLGPFRCVSCAALPRLALSDPGYGWTAELQGKAYRLDLRVREVPVRARRRRGGRSKISGDAKAVVQAGWVIVSTILRLRFTSMDAERGFARGRRA